MSLSQETCLLCLSVNKNIINFYSDQGKELNIISILSTHFWFQLDEIKVLSQNICYECWKNTESFHEFYQSIRIAHKKFETVFVKIENEQDVEDNAEMYPTVQLQENNFITEFLEIENKHSVEDDESSNTSVCEIPCTNSIDTETRAFDALPTKTRKKYLQAYDKLQTWKISENIEKECFSEAVLLEYFYFLKTKYKPNSLYVQYSMLRTTIQRNDNVDIAYPEVTSLLKKSAVGFVQHKLKSNVFQPDDLQRFFTEAKDSEFLAVKVMMIFMIYGVTRTDDLTKVNVHDISEQGSVFVIKFTETKTNVVRSFTVENEYATCVKKYKELRPAKVAHDRFFLNYQKGKCTVQPIGKNKFLNAPKAIAKFLKLDGVESFTMYSFRRKSSKRYRGKRSSNVPDSYDEHCPPNERGIGDLNPEQINSERSNEGSIITRSTDSLTVPTTGNKIGDDDKVIAIDLLPQKSQNKYRRSYSKFMDWKTDEDFDEENLSEAVILDYFKYLKTKYKPTSIWAEYSMLRASIQEKHNVDICYPEVKSFLKWCKFGYFPQKGLVFQPDEIRRFLCEAEDYEFLAVKVITIFGIFGITGDPLTKVDVNDVSEQGSVIVIKIPETKTNSVRSFTLENEYATYVQKYKQLRPENTPHSRFFINYENGRCTLEPIGKNKFFRAAKAIAHFLNLKDADSYTSQSLRRDSLKRNRGMRSSNVLDSYIEECLPSKRKINDINSEQLDLENMATSTITSSIHASTFPTSANKDCEDVKASAWNLLPEKSRERYIRSYDKLVAWKTDENVDQECFSEAVMLDYFNHLITKYKPSSLWSEYSMLRLTIKKKDNIDICYPEVTSLLKKSSVGFVPQKTRSNVFQSEELRRFLSEAEDIKYLDVKVIMIFGIYGATSADELTNVEVNDVTEQGSVFVIRIPDAKTNVRSFTVENEYAAYVRKYKKLRPGHTDHRRFFINYQNGKCTVQPIGRNKILNATKVIANFLNLEDADNYTGTSFRRTSKKLLADNCADILTTKRHGGCSLSAAIDNCIEEEPISNRKIEDPTSEPFHSKRSRKQNSSTITSSMDITTIANELTPPNTFQTTFQAYNVQPHQVQQNQLLPYGTSTVANALTIPTTVQSFHVQPHQTQPCQSFPYGTGTNNFHRL